MAATKTEAPPQRIAAEDLEVPEELSQRNLRRRFLIAVGIVLAVVAAITLVPGLADLRSRFAHARPGWLALGATLKLLSALSYVLVFRAVFCRRMSWSLSYQIGMSELGANALFPTGGAGGLALGAWALRRGGMSTTHIARRTVAFFLITSTANVVGVIVIGLGLALGVLPGHVSLALTLVPAVIAAAAIVGVLGAGRLAGRVQRRVRERRGAASRLVAALGAIDMGVREAVSLLRHPDRYMLIGAIGYLALDIMVLWATFRAFGSAPPMAILWLAYLIGELGGLIPVPGGIGGVDAGLVGTFVLYGTPLNSATAAVLAYRAIALWVPAVFGAAAFVRLRHTLRGEAHQIALCAPGEELEVVGRGRVVLDSAGPVISDARGRGGAATR